MQPVLGKDSVILGAVVTPTVALARLGVGLAQGALLYLLFRAGTAGLWPADAPYVFAPLLLVGVMLPVLLISALGHLKPRQAAMWMLAAALLIALLALHDIWRGGGSSGPWGSHCEGATANVPSALLFLFSGAGLFIAHALVLAGAQDGRRIAAYATYFEMAWKLAIQLLFSAFFVGALWLVLWLGAALFMLVKLAFLKDLLGRAWFVIPVICFAFSCAMHLTDVRPAIVRGIRTLLLVLLSWILPITALIVAGFMFSLPFTGLSALWATRHATSVLLGTSAVLVVLINAAFQNGDVSAAVARVVAVSARLAALLLLPICALAVYALALRVDDYGWTSDRIIAAACLLVAACYALGYGWAARKRGLWLHGIAGVNVATAFVVLAVLLGLFSPLADPARLSVSNQMARFAAGKIGAEKFDFNYLRFDGMRYGREALQRLQAQSGGADAALVRERAAHALKLENRWQSSNVVAAPLVAADIAANVKLWPAGAALPAGFLRQDWRLTQPNWELPWCLRKRGDSCDGYLIDFDGDGKPEVLLVGHDGSSTSILLGEDGQGQWVSLGQLQGEAARCDTMWQQLAAGNFKLVAPRVRDLEVAGQRVRVLSSNAAEAWRCRPPAP
ncbi:DUF4153 domain-containing protein [Janthinobacterium sp.]|uniref:DUF4153 domain-containing protein n=1 Tax=Janthinobacterium sp. TaxID=1871054 RepID=UPI00293D991B|nr:DUF4153 domain-containing protein [Janthinobacterium sp.]